MHAAGHQVIARPFRRALEEDGCLDFQKAARVQEVLAEVDLLDVSDRRFSYLSAGMRQRLAIARSLLHRPRLLFLDEPSRSLDPTATQRLHQLIRRLMDQHGMTVFLITHDLAEAEALCQRIAFMHRGRLRAIGRPAALRQQLQPQRHYTVQVNALPAAVCHHLCQIAPGLTCESSGSLHQVRFRSSEEDGVLAAVLAALCQHDLMITSVEGAPPTLEEVFTHFTQDEAG